MFIHISLGNYSMDLHRQAALIASQLPEVNMSQPFGEGCDVYKVMDKVFMLSFMLQSKPTINLKVQPEHGEMLRQTYPYIHAGWHMNKQHWISVVEDQQLTLDFLTDLIEDSYHLVVSKLRKVERLRIELLLGIADTKHHPK